MSSTTPLDLSSELREGFRSLSDSAGESIPRMSETSIDGTLLLHSIGMEPADFVYGVSARTHPYHMWSTSKKKDVVVIATQVFDAAFAAARSSLQHQAESVGAIGVIGIQVRIQIKVHYTFIEVKGTAIRPMKTGRKNEEEIFTTNLQARDVVLLHRAGWSPMQCLATTNYAVVPYRSHVRFTENVELTSLTNALYKSRGDALERLQTQAISMSSDGIVGTDTRETLLGVNTFQIVAFQALGTAIRKVDSREDIDMVLSLPIDDKVAFDVAALRGASSNLLSYRELPVTDDRMLQDSRSSKLWRLVHGVKSAAS